MPTMLNRSPGMFGKARDALEGTSLRLLPRRQARYHAYHTNALDEDQSYVFGSTFTETPAHLQAGFGVPHGGAVLLSLTLRAVGHGLVRDPYVELRAADGRRVRQYVERGVAGRRLINVSALAGASRVRLSFSDLTGSLSDAVWVVDKPVVDAGPRLVLAPHPDDAELAAFGFYADQDAYVVTACAGEVGTHDYGGLFSADRTGALLRGRVRVSESLTAPLVGAIPRERCANLGYFDGTLTSMYLNRAEPARSAGVDSVDLGLFRAAGAEALLPERSVATWEGLVSDVVHLLKVSGARTVAFPHPILENHPDHAVLGLAAMEALQQMESPPPSVLTYAVHGPGGVPGANIHPVGTRDGVVSLPPGKHPKQLFDGLCSVPLDESLQRRKALAVDTYRDLKDAEGPLPAEQLSVRVRRGLREVYRALVVYDLGLLRRFVRPNELFFRLDVDALSRWEALFAEDVRRRFGAAR